MHPQRPPVIASLRSSTRRRSSPALLAVVVALVVLATPGVAAAEGPGYDGRADRLVLKWRENAADRAQERARGLEVFGRGFRGGSEVTLRVGAGVERTAVADATGTVSLVVDEHAHPGATIVAVGQAPSGTAWTLLGSVPSEGATSGPNVLVTVAVAAMGVLALAGMLVQGRVQRRGKGQGRGRRREIRVPIYRAP